MGKSKLVVISVDIARSIISAPDSTSWDNMKTAVTYKLRERGCFSERHWFEFRSPPSRKMIVENGTSRCSACSLSSACYWERKRGPAIVMLSRRRASRQASACLSTTVASKNPVPSWIWRQHPTSLNGDGRYALSVVLDHDVCSSSCVR